MHVAQHVGLAAAGCAGAGAAKFFQVDVAFLPIAPSHRKFVADDVDAGGMERVFGHEEKLATILGTRYNINSMIRHLYVHTPFCAKVCPYCAFHVHQGGAAAQREFVSVLRTEWARAREEFPLALETIYFGGGTPSILSAELFAELALELPPSGSVREFTLEVNPATVTFEKAAAWRAAGVNRISLGAQSFDAEMLEVLGRQHAPGDIAETCALLRAQGFENINLDLMFALPSQSETKWEETLQAALACGPQHLSAYALTYEEDTPFFEKLQRGEWRQDEAREIVMFERTREVLGAAGLVDYEISNFARPGFESQHNLAYWRGADYLGLGPSACSTIDGLRWRNVPDTKRYADRIARGESVRGEMEKLDSATRAKERIMFGLRMREGVARTEFGSAAPRLDDLANHGLAYEENGRICLTSRGKLVADSVAEMFV
jgi:oxygen-independent coproporphyrinogen-3 oxidase